MLCISGSYFGYSSLNGYRAEKLMIDTRAHQPTYRQAQWRSQRQYPTINMALGKNLREPVSYIERQLVVST